MPEQHCFLLFTVLFQQRFYGSRALQSVEYGLNTNQAQCCTKRFQHSLSKQTESQRHNLFKHDQFSRIQVCTIHARVSVSQVGYVRPGKAKFTVLDDWLSDIITKLEKVSLLLMLVLLSSFLHMVYSSTPVPTNVIVTSASNIHSLSFRFRH